MKKLNLTGIVCAVAFGIFGVVYHKTKCAEYEREILFQKNLLAQQERENLEWAKEYFALGYQKGRSDIQRFRKH